jgi:hypothetical protein
MEETMRYVAWLVAVLLAGSTAAWAQKSALGSKDVERRPGVEQGAPPPPATFKPLPELKGVVSWKTLAEVTPVKQKDRFVPQFSSGIEGLDRKEVKLQGFMMPLDMGERQKRFLLVAMPPSCAFCLPGGPDQMVEVQARSPVKYGFEPIIVTGRFVVLKDDPMGLYYRLTDAVAQ